MHVYYMYVFSVCWLFPLLQIELPLLQVMANLRVSIGGPDMRFFMAHCHLLEEVWMPDMRLFMDQCHLLISIECPDMQHGQCHLQKCLGRPDVRGQCHPPQQECWHAAMLVIVSAPCCKRCNTLLPAGGASLIAKSIYQHAVTLYWCWSCCSEAEFLKSSSCLCSISIPDRGNVIVWGLN